MGETSDQQLEKIDQNKSNSKSALERKSRSFDVSLIVASQEKSCTETSQFEDEYSQK